MLSDMYKQKISLNDVLNPKLRKALEDLAAEHNTQVDKLKLLGGYSFMDLDADGQGDLTVVLPDGRESFYSAAEDTMYSGEED